jgi:hypothetical protein
MSDKRDLLLHFLATLDYRTAKAVRDAPPGFGDFQAGSGSRTPSELVAHMNSLLRYTLVSFGGSAGDRPETGADFETAVARFNQVVRKLATTLSSSSLQQPGLAEQLLQGPFSDAMTHAGQLALLRRLAGSPLPAENFFVAPIQVETLLQPE